jgi:hypothetical protein
MSGYELHCSRQSSVIIRRHQLSDWLLPACPHMQHALFLRCQAAWPHAWVGKALRFSARRRYM